MRVRNAFVTTLLLFSLFLGLIVLATPTVQAGNFCDHTGRNSLGHLRALHVDPTTGLIMDSQGCQVMLRGVNTFPAVGKGGDTTMTDELVKLGEYGSLNGDVDINRVLINPVWYNENVTMPNMGILYQTWIDNIISTDDQNGIYTELDKGPQFTEPPCGGGSGNWCTNQTTGSQEAQGTPETGDPDGYTDPNAWQEASDGNYMQPAYDFWTAVAMRYAGDNGVLYDLWNESHSLVSTNPAQWDANQEQMIKDIRTPAPNSLIIFYGGPDYNQGLHYTEPNLVVDDHIYNPNFTCSNLTDAGSLMHEAYADGHGFLIDEWGDGNVSEPYNGSLNNCATSLHVGLVYFGLQGMFDNSENLTSVGQTIITDNQTAYANY